MPRHVQCCDPREWGCGEKRLEGSEGPRVHGLTFGTVFHCSGAVVTLECVEKLIRKDMVDPVNGDTLTERDIIVLQRVSCYSLTAARTPS